MNTETISQQEQMIELSLSEAIDEFLYDKEIENVADKTMEVYNYVFDSFKSFLGEDPPIGNLGKSALRQYLMNLKNKNLKPSTVSIHYRNLNTFYNWLADEDYIKDNPMDNISKPHTPSKYPRVISEEQVKKLLDSERQRTNRWAGQRNYTILLLFVETGLRLNELVTAKESKLDLSEHTLIVFGKGRKERMVAFGPKVSKNIRKWLDRRDELGEIYDDEYLFIDQKGEQLKKRHVNRIITRIQDRAGLEEETISPHVLRHTSATLAAKNGMNVAELKQAYGWERLETARKYIHLSGRDVKEAVHKASPIENL